MTQRMKPMRDTIRRSMLFPALRLMRAQMKLIADSVQLREMAVRVDVLGSFELDVRIEEVAAEIGLTEQLQMEAGLLSHGQKQWLEIGMLLMQDPELLMLDEPIAGMSVRERELTADLLQRICRNRSMIVIEHDMDFVKKIAHKVTVMHQGKILAEGPMDKVQSDPKVIDVYLGH